MEDKYGRAITYLRISVTDLCNLRCIYCMPEKGVKKLKHDDVLRLEEIEHIADQFISLGITKIRITGGEPLVRKGITDLLRKLGNDRRLKDFSMTTNGILLDEFADELKKTGIKRINISVDTLDARKYSYITRGGDIERLKKGLDSAKNTGFEPIKLNVVLIKDFNDDEIEDFARLTYEGLNVRFIELMPLGDSVLWASSRFISNQYVLNSLKGLNKVQYDSESSAVNYRLPGANGHIGLISPVSCKFCRNCSRIRLSAEGRLYPCLHSEMSLDLKTLLRQGRDIKGAVQEFIYNKPFSHRFENKEFANRNMIQIGG